ncbi:MAG: hypothetical protein A2428_11515 [Bdellovibrionales bacterium RIFOXYC1_FULL_54_43]|nr:MAG: hypothetical protein A2428_11515 [Bdellovibrionales bacterium RIFOXYC1_FULL_54_43]OFZ80182.1 MAG: hypothetical protein A2603_11360 [Bdellovibrionales bacterium RIFOXYD1_FULL_55_31]
MKRLLEEARRMIRINSVTTHGNEELANYAATLLQDRGFRVQLQPVTHSLEGVSKRQFNVIGILGDSLVDRKIRKGLLLNSHLDTVSPGLPENWTQTGGDPFCTTVKDGKVYGLGAVDAKLDFLCKLHAAGRFREKKLRNPIYLVGSCGEELGMFGAKYLIKALTLNPKYVVIAEPSNLKIVYAHKSQNIFKISVGYQQIERDARGFNRKVHLSAFGKSAHAAYPHLGVNAIKAMFDFLQRAADSGFELRFTEFQGGDMVNKVPDAANSTFYVTSHQLEDFKRFFREMVRVEGGEKAYRVELGGLGDAGVRFLPDLLFPCLSEIVGLFEKISSDFSKLKDETYDPPSSTVNFGTMAQSFGGVDLSFDLRLLPDLPTQSIEEHVEEGVKKIAKGYPSLNISVSRERMNPSLNMTPGHEIVKICHDAMVAANMEPLFEKKATATEAALFQQAGYEAVVFGPGLSHGSSHSPNEHNLLEHLERASHFYEKLIEKVCL